MKILLDTHSFLWFVLGDASLSQTAKRAIEDRSNEPLVSPISYWEIALKINLGKYRLNKPFDDFWKAGMTDNGMSVLHIHVHHASRLLSMPFHHRDPFDRMLVAQALVEQVPLMSCDDNLDRYGVQRLW